MKYSLYFLALLAFSVSACSLSRSTSYSDDFNAQGERESSRETSMEFYGKDADGQLKYGKTLLSRGKYDQALSAFRAVLQKDEDESVAQEEALLMIGKTHAHVLNMKKDFEQARYYFGRLLRDFPDSKFAPEAEKQLSLLSRTK